MSSYLDEAQLEIATVDYFRELGYEYVHGPQIVPDGEARERADCGQMVLPRWLRWVLLTKLLSGEIAPPSSTK